MRSFRPLVVKYHHRNLAPPKLLKISKKKNEQKKKVKVGPQIEAFRPKIEKNERTDILTDES